MDAAQKPRRDGARLVLQHGLVAALLLALTFALQWRGDAFGAELGDDAASHYISGLMIRDYVANGFAGSPLAYVSWYHAHYPLVGIGHWGPAYYLLEAAWMLAVSPSIPSAIVLAGVLTAATAYLIYLYGVRKLQLPLSYALGAAVLFILVPIVQAGSRTIMLDIPIALLAMAAVYAYASFLESGRAAWSLAFGLLAAAAVLTKGNGALLALLPPLAVAASGRWRLVASPWFWAPAAIVVVAAGPWYALTYDQVSAGFRYSWGLAYSTTASAANARTLVANLGPAILALAAVGVATALRRRAAPGGVAAMALLGLLASVWAFQVIVPAAIEDRYLAPLVPPAALFAALGARALVDLVTARGAPRSALDLAAAALLAVAALPAALSLAPLSPVGLRDLAQRAWRQRAPANPVVLIAAKEASEAAAVAELAMADPHRPSLFAVRASRLLGGGGYNRADYVPKFGDAAEVGAVLDRMRVPLVLYQADSGGWAHVAQVEALRTTARPAWRLLGRAGAAHAPVSLYSLPAADGKVADAGEWVAVAAPKHLQ